MASGKKPKMRKRRSRVRWELITVLLILCIGGGLFVKLGLPALRNKQNNDNNASEGSTSLSAEETVLEDDSSVHADVIKKDGEHDENPETDASTAEGAGTVEKAAKKIENDRDLWVKDKLQQMETGEKVAQLFFVSADTLTEVENTTIVGDTFTSRLNEFPVGGIILSDGNIEDPEQLKSLTQMAEDVSRKRTGIDLFIGVEEEGGSVLQIADNPEFKLKDVGNMTEIGAQDNAQAAYDVGNYIGQYLDEYGINVNFAPVADLIYNTPNSVVKNRAFGQDSVLVSDMVSKEVEALQKWNVSAVLKHFPGYGTIEGDPLEGDAVSLRTLTELETFDYAPFRKGIESGADFVMVGHIIMKTVDPESIPASVASYFMTDVLKDKWGYEGIVITEDMSMAAIRNRYSPEEAVIMAINNGADMIVLTSGFEEVYEKVKDAANEGQISEERLDDAVKRVLQVKYDKQQKQ